MVKRLLHYCSIFPRLVKHAEAQDAKPMVRAAGGAHGAKLILRAGESDLSDLSDGAHGSGLSQPCAVSDPSDLSDLSDCRARSIGSAQCAPPAHGTCRQCP